jgi:hypothetical protein
MKSDQVAWAQGSLWVQAQPNVVNLKKIIYTFGW